MASTKDLRETQQGKRNNLFISHDKPHRPVTRSTIFCWILSLFKEAGIDTTIFKAHSVRGASTTAAANALVPLQEVLDMADLSKDATFCQGCNLFFPPLLERLYFRSLFYSLIVVL